MSKKTGKLIVIVGPSGSGKGTIVNEILKLKNDIHLSISMTTRNMRNGEIDKVHYFFTTKDEFLNLVNKGEMLEYAQYVDNYYGTPKQFVLDYINNGESVILEIDSQGAEQIKEKYKDAITIFINPPSMDELKIRLINRNTDSLSDIDKRIRTAISEMEYSKKCDYVVVNDKLEVAVEEILNIINKV